VFTAAMSVNVCLASGPKRSTAQAGTPLGPSCFFLQPSRRERYFVKKHNLVPVFIPRRKKQADVREKCNTTFVILLPCDKLLELVRITQAMLLDAGVDGDADLGGG